MRDELVEAAARRARLDGGAFAPGARSLYHFEVLVTAADHLIVMRRGLFATKQHCPACRIVGLR